MHVKLLKNDLPYFVGDHYAGHLRLWCKPEVSLQGSILSSHHVSPKDQSQAIRLRPSHPSSLALLLNHHICIHCVQNTSYISHKLYFTYEKHRLVQR